MTIPALYARCNEITATARLKKTYAALLNVERLAAADYGSPDGWDLSLTRKQGSNTENVNSGELFWNTYYSPYLKNVSEPANYKIYKCHNYYGTAFNCSGFKRTIFPDGSCINHFINNQFYFLVYDSNCSALPNTLGKDVWDIGEFYWGYLYESNNDESTRATITGLKQLRENPNLYSEYIDECKKHTYNGGAPSKCFAVFVYNGWKFPKELHW